MIMTKKIYKKSASVILYRVIPPAAGILYAAAAVFIPVFEKEMRIIIIAVLLVIVSVSDILEHKIPLTACAVIFSINLVFSVVVYYNPVSWIVSMFLFTVLMTVYLVNRSLIGLGDILLITVCVQSLMPENILKFLFLTFVFSAVSGLFTSCRAKSLKNVFVPASPCIAAAFLLQVN